MQVCAGVWWVQEELIKKASQRREGDVEGTGRDVSR